ncbi:MAG TPA: hypothetical protein VHL11_08810 [Phototrophicaceae bacterium]|jgi:hypothetical protein|nr:hypothetical protein [Phototrophicaceae bacterium]
MLRTLRRVVSDIARRKNIEAYAATVLALGVAIFGLVQDSVSQNLQMAALLAGVGLLVFKTTEPRENNTLDLDDVLKDRQSYGNLRDFIHGAGTVWIYGASAVNVMRNIDDLKREVLDRGGKIRVLMQDPKEESSVNILYRQLDQMHDLRRDIETTLSIVQRVSGRETRGTVEHRFVPYSPGFSLLIVDPDSKNARLVVEFYGYQNELITERMHIEIHRDQSHYWFEYWEKQFRIMWDSARSETIDSVNTH